MSIFNSLGSNYDLNFVFKSLLSTREYHQKLKNLLDNKYKGEAVLVYKGREAIELALRLSNLPKNSSVAINGFTCYAIYKAIKNAGYLTHYLDINKSDLNFSANSLKKALDETSNIKAVIVQNTLGYPCDIEKIIKICSENNIILVEDLAHSVGTKYLNGKESGTVGDFVALSFSQDKIVDAVSGGALIIRNKKFRNISTDLPSPNYKQQAIDRLYPLFTFLIRKTYKVGLGKIIHAVLKSLELLSQPMIDQGRIKTLPNWYCYLAFEEFIKLNEVLEHRRKIAKVYAESIQRSILSSNLTKSIAKSTNLRFPIFVKKRKSLIDYLKKKNIYVSDIWYDAPIAPKKYMALTDYANQCPVAENVSETIVNLPTHRNISTEDAENIAKEVNKWLRSA